MESLKSPNAAYKRSRNGAVGYRSAYPHSPSARLANAIRPRRVQRRPCTEAQKLMRGASASSTSMSLFTVLSKSSAEINRTSCDRSSSGRAGTGFSAAPTSTIRLRNATARSIS